MISRHVDCGDSAGLPGCRIGLIGMHRVVNVRSASAVTPPHLYTHALDFVQLSGRDDT
jgi:hypothetical protein